MQFAVNLIDTSITLRNVKRKKKTKENLIINAEMCTCGPHKKRDPKLGAISLKIFYPFARSVQKRIPKTWYYAATASNGWYQFGCVGVNKGVADISWS